MKLYSENKDYKLYHGNMLDMLEVIEPNSIDSIVTDPPYGLTSITKRFGKGNSKENQYGKDGSFQRLTKGFMGSGTTAVACKELGRHYIGFEIDKNYWQIAVDRVNGISQQDKRLKESGITSIYDFLEE